MPGEKIINGCVTVCVCMWQGRKEGRSDLEIKNDDYVEGKVTFEEKLVIESVKR